MPRNISGTYTLAPGNPVVTGTIIEAAWANPTLSDIANALTDSLSRSGSGGMLVPFRNADGAVGTPGMSWVNEPTSGWYRAALNDFWYSVGNENIFRITKAGIELAPGKGAINFNAPNRVQDTDPAPVPNGTGWFESDTGNYYIRYQNPDLTYTYIQTNSALTGIGVGQIGVPNGVASLDGAGQVPASQLGNAILITEKAAPLGVATLDAFGKVLASQLPPVIVSPTFTDLFVTNQTVLGNGVAVGTSTFQSHTLGGAGSSATFTRWQANNAGMPLALQKSRGAAVGTHAIVLNGDGLANFISQGSDGVGFFTAGNIVSEVDLAPAVGIVPGRWLFNTASNTGVLTEALRIDSSQRVVVGGAAAQNFGSGNFHRVQVHGNTTATAAIGVARWVPDALGSTLTLAKSRNATIGSFTLVANNDLLGQIAAMGSDNASFVPAALINFTVDGTPGVNDMPGRITFLTTPDGAFTPSEAMRIDSGQRVVIGNTAGISIGGFNSRLQLHGASSQDQARFTIARWLNDTTPSQIAFAKSRGTPAGTQGLLTNGDNVMQLLALGSDGVAFIPMASITASVDAVTAANDMPGRLSFATTPDGQTATVEAMRIDNAQRVVIGNTAAIAGAAGTIPRFQLHGTDAATARINTTRWSADPNAASFAAGKSRGAAIGTHAIVQADDNPMAIQALASDGVAFIQAASITAFIDGVPAVNDMPGRLVFSTTPPAAVTPVEGMRIDSAQRVIMSGGAFAAQTIGGLTTRLQVLGVDGNTSGITSVRYQANTGGAQMIWAKSRGATIGSQGLVIAGDVILAASFHGSDGVTFSPAASWQVVVDPDGAAAVGSMPGAFMFHTAPNGTIVSVPRVKIGMQGNVILNASGAALATTATGGFTFIPTCAGVPTGVPVPLPTGAAPMVINTTANKLMFYSTGAWRDAGP